MSRLRAMGVWTSRLRLELESTGVWTLVGRGSLLVLVRCKQEDFPFAGEWWALMGFHDRYEEGQG